MLGFGEERLGERDFLGDGGDDIGTIIKEFLYDRSAILTWGKQIVAMYDKFF